MAHLLHIPVNVAACGLFLVMQALKVLRLSGVQLMLEGLYTYSVLDPAETLANQQTVVDRKGRKHVAKQMEELKSKGFQLAKTPMVGKWLGIPGSIEEMDYMVILGLVILVNSVITIIFTCFNGAANSVVVYMALFALLMPVHVMLRFELVEEKDWLVRGVLAVALGLCMLGSHAVLSRWSIAHHLFDFGLLPATAGFNAGVNAMGEWLTKRGVFSGPYTPYMTEPRTVALAFSVWAGVLGAALIGPSVRFAGMLYRLLTPPAWARPYLRHRWASVKAAQLAFVLPLLLVMVQFAPVASYWGLGEYGAYLAFLGLLTLTAITHICSLRSVCQAFLDGGLLEWYMHVHSGREFQGKMGAIKLRLLIIKVALGKAAAQLAVLGLLSLAACCVLLIHAWGAGLLPLLPVPLEGAAGASSRSGNSSLGAGEAGSCSASGDSQVGEGVLEGMGRAEGEGCAGGEVGGPLQQGNLQDLFAFMFRFLSWWAALVWCVSGYSTMVVARLGLNSSN